MMIFDAAKTMATFGVALVLVVGCGRGGSGGSHPGLPPSDSPKQGNNSDGTPSDTPHPSLPEHLAGSCSNERNTMKDSGDVLCCVVMSKLFETSQADFIKEVDGKKYAEITGDVCPVVAFEGLADTDLGLFVKGAKTVLTSASSFNGIRGDVRIEGESDEKRSEIKGGLKYLVQRNVEGIVTRDAGLVLKNVDIFGGELAFDLRVTNGKQTLHLENVDVVDTKHGILFNMGAKNGNEDIKFLTAGMEKNFKPVFKQVRFKNIYRVFTGTYPLDITSIQFLDEEGRDYPADNRPLAALSGSYLGTKASLKPQFTYLVENSWSLLPGSLLVVEAGSIVKFKNSLLDIRGAALKVEGTQAKPVTFTSYRDDMFGDSNLDDSATTPAIRDWRGIRISLVNSTSSAVSFKHTNIKYSGVTVSRSKLDLEHVNFVSAGTCADGNYATFYAECGTANQKNTSLFIAYGSKVNVLGNVNFSMGEDELVVYAIALSKHTAAKGDTALIKNAGANISIAATGFGEKICLSETNRSIQRPFTNDKTGYNLQGIDDSWLVLKSNCHAGF